MTQNSWKNSWVITIISLRDPSINILQLKFPLRKICLIGKIDWKIRLMSLLPPNKENFPTIRRIISSTGLWTQRTDLISTEPLVKVASTSLTTWKTSRTHLRFMWKLIRMSRMTCFRLYICRHHRLKWSTWKEKAWFETESNPLLILL